MAHLYTVWVPDSNNNKILKVENGVITKEIQVGNKPRGICVGLNGRDIYVTNMSDNTVSWIRNEKREKDIPVGKSPMCVTIDSTGAAWVVNYQSNNISKIINGFKIFDVMVGIGPRGICVDRDDVIWVTNFLSNDVSKIIEGTRVITIPTGNNPYGICADKFGHIWVANSGSNTVSKIHNNKKILDIQVGKMPYGICLNLRNEIYVSNYLGDTVSKIVNSQKVENDIAVGDGPHGLCIDKNNALYVANTNSNILTKIVNDVVTQNIEVCYTPINFGDSTGMQQYILFEYSSEHGKVSYDDLTEDLQDIINSGGTGSINAKNVIFNNTEFPTADSALNALLGVKEKMEDDGKNIVFMINNVDIGVDNIGEFVVPFSTYARGISANVPKSTELTKSIKFDIEKYIDTNNWEVIANGEITIDNSSKYISKSFDNKILLDKSDVIRVNIKDCQEGLKNLVILVNLDATS